VRRLGLACLKRNARGSRAAWSVATLSRVGDNIDIAWAAGASAAALMWAAWLVWCDLFARRHPPYEALRQAAAALDYGDAQAALSMFKWAARVATRHGDLGSLGGAYVGMARARAALGNEDGASALERAALDAARQLSASSRDSS